MIKKYAFIFSILLLGSSVVYGQEVRFSFQAGAAIPVGDIAQNTKNPDKGGFATTGFDIRMVIERMYKNNFVVGVSLGYSVFGVDKDAIRMVIDPNNPENVLVESQPFQNINLQARGGYNLALVEGKLNVTPFVDLGLGIFNSAYYVIQKDGLKYLRDGNSGVAFLITPGLDLSFAVNDFVAIKVFGNYQFANYKVDEKYTLLGLPNPEVTLETVSYNYSSVSTGVGVTFMF